MNKNIENKDKSIKAAGAYLLCLLTAFITMLICTRSSPLYACNNWDDSNSYFTVGKSIFKGLVPYRDLFDQKGMMLYTLYGIASLISYKTFFGVFIIEVIAASLTCTAMFKILNLYMRPAISMVLMPGAAAFIYSTRSFWWGGSAEEMMMPLFMWGLYLSVRYFKDEYPKPVSNKTLIIGGILAGCVLNIKFNSLGFFFAWMVMILIADLTIDPRSAESSFGKKLDDNNTEQETGNSDEAHNKSFMLGTRLKRCVIHGCIFLLGMFIATILWIVYFAVNGALYDWFHVYIYLNVFVYSEKLSLIERFYNMLKIIYNHMLSNPYCGVLAALGGIGFIVMKSKWIEKLNVVMLAGFTGLLIFIGGVELQYYSLPLWTFAILGMIAIGRIVEYVFINSISKKKSKAGINPYSSDVDENSSANKEQLSAEGDTVTDANKAIVDSRKIPSGAGSHTIQVIVTICAVILAAIISYVTSMNTFFMKYDRDDIWLYHFTNIVENSGIENPTLINMGCFDAGLYTTCGIVPTCRFFQTQTIKLSDVGDVQGDFIRNGKTDFVLVRDTIPNNIDDHYELIAEEKWEQSGSETVFYLYELVK